MIRNRPDDNGRNAPRVGAFGEADPLEALRRSARRPYAKKRRPGLTPLAVVGSHLLKHARGVSHDQVCAQQIDNAHFRFFTRCAK
jgi:hypothetical protein